MNKFLLLCLIFVAISAVTVDLEKIRADMLTKHNEYRQLHQVGNLKRSSSIELVAQKYAEYLATINSLQHSNNGYGENLFYGYYSSSIGNTAVKLWYDEVSGYNFNNPGYKSGIGHFTQVVWKGSTEIGCGVGCKSNNYCYIVCDYNPAGNVGSQFASNVFPAKEGGTTQQTTQTTPQTTPDTTTTQTQTETSNDSELETFRNEMLDRHNHYRALHQAGNLIRNAELEKIAQATAEQSLQEGGFLSFPQTYSEGHIGRNAYSCGGMSPTGISVTDSWYNKIANYDFEKAVYVSSASLFTQLVWKNTQKIGCAKACNAAKKCYIYCAYYPAGNYGNQMAANVLPKK